MHFMDYVNFAFGGKPTNHQKNDKMTAVRQLQDHAMDTSDSSDSNASLVNGNEPCVSFYKPGFKYNNFVNKLDGYNNNQLLLPTEFYKTLLAKAVFSSGDDKNNVYKNMLFAKDRDFEQVCASLRRSLKFFIIIEISHKTSIQ